MKAPAHHQNALHGAVAVMLLPIALIVCSAVADGTNSVSDAPFVAQISEGPRLPLAVAGHAGGLVRGLPVVVGGSSWPEDPQTGQKHKVWRNDCFVFRDGRWAPGPSLAQPLSDCAYVSGPDGLYIAGGAEGHHETSDVQHLADTRVGSSWHPLASLPEPVEGAAGAIANGTFYVFGGMSEGKISNALWSLDLTADQAQWKSLSPLPTIGRAFSAFVAVDSGLYLFGGIVYPPFQPATTVFGDVYKYDPASDHWHRLDGLNFPGYGWSATALPNRQIMLTGRVGSLDQVSDEIFLVNLDTLDVTSVGRMVIPACCLTAIQMGSNTWWLSGGEPSATAIRTDRTTILTLEARKAP